jgi:hypothetical protein
MPEHDDLLHDLAELGRSIPASGAVGMHEAVLARLAAPAPPAQRGPRTALRVAAVAITALLALLLVPPVRAAVADWFGFGSVMVGEDDGTGEPPTASPTPPGPRVSVSEAAARVAFDVFELPALGEPRGAWVSPDERVLTLVWDDDTRLDQSSSYTYTFAKTSESFQLVSVDGQEALWFPDSHEVAIVDAEGREVTESRRRVGSTLVWMVGGSTLRLEGELSLTQAVALAESARRLP